MSRAVLALGANVGPRAATIATAVRSFGARIAVSGLYETPPWGPVAQPDFLNLVLIVDDPEVDARGWLGRARAAEAIAGRVRDVRWGPRSLDVDVIDVDGSVSEDPALTLPHPRAHQRAFVLRPWGEIAPDACLPGWGTVRDLLRALPAADVEAVRLVGRVD